LNWIRYPSRAECVRQVGGSGSEVVTVRQGTAAVGVVLVVIEVITAVVVNLATSGVGRWALWAGLAVLVVLTCVLVWWRESRHVSQSSADVRIRASRKGVVEGSPAHITGHAADSSVRIEADREGRITNSGVTIEDRTPGQGDDKP
jgi:ABC-type nickel/cobalt efflux system permease component RcnA